MDKKKIFKKLREAEAEMAFASPKRAARLTKNIVKWKAEAFDR